MDEEPRRCQKNKRHCSALRRRPRILARPQIAGRKEAGTLAQAMRHGLCCRARAGTHSTAQHALAHHASTSTLCTVVNKTEHARSRQCAATRSP